MLLLLLLGDYTGSYIFRIDIFFKKSRNINDFLEDYLPMDVLKVYSYL